MLKPVKMGYITGYNLVFSAYQESGVGRGIEQQPLPELATGYYGADPITDLVAGDEVVASVLEDMTWEGETMYYLSEDYLEWEGERMYWEGDWLIDTDTIINQVMTSVGDVVGAQEYTVDADFWGDFQDSLDSIVISSGQSGSRQTIDESGLDEYGQPKQLSSSEVGYVPLYMKEV